MNKIVSFVLVVAILLSTGCWLTGSPTKPVANPNSQNIIIPAMPPIASTADAAAHGKAARNAVETAQANVKEGKNKAEKGDAVGAVPPLTKADSQLTSAISSLEQAKIQGQALELQIKAMDDGHKAQIQAYEAKLKTQQAELNTKIETMTAAAKKANDAIQKQQKEIQDLKNEVTRESRKWMTFIGTGLMCAAVGCFAAFFFASFMAGIRVGIILAACGSTILGVAALLPTIVLASKIILGLIAASALGYAAYKVFTHVPHQTYVQLKSLKESAQPTLPEIVPSVSHPQVVSSEQKG